MAEISKQALLVDNNQSFPDNNSGTITPVDLRSFNVDLIDSTVNQAVYTSNSSSWNVQIGQLNAFTASQQPSFTALNSFTASQLTINTGVNTFTQSANGSITRLNQATASLQNFTSSINQILVNGSSIGTSTRLFFNGFVSASIVPNVDGAIASITVLSDPSLVTTSSFNAYTASTDVVLNGITASFNSFSASQNSFNQSATASLVQLLNLSSSLSGGYATQGELDYSASVLQNNINTLASFTASYATTGSNTFTGDQTLIDNAGNFYTITDASGSLMLVAKGFTSASLHLSASAAGIGNFIFKNSSVTADTIISGSANIFTNPASATAGFKRYIGGSSNYYPHGTGIPQISGSMGFSPAMNGNIISNVTSNGVIMRGPVSSSAYTMNGNIIMGASTISLGTSAANHFERAVSGLNMNGNALFNGNISMVANTNSLSSSVVLTGNLVFGGSVTLNNISSSTTYNSNVTNGSFTINNRFTPAAGTNAGATSARTSTNTMYGTGHVINIDGTNVSTTQGKSFSFNIFAGTFLTASVPDGDASNILATGIIGNGLIVTGSTLPSSFAGADSANSGQGSLFAGRFNSLDGTKDMTAETVFAVGTGTSYTNRKTGLLVDSGSNTIIEGSLTITGSVYGNVSASSITAQTASIDLSVANYFTLTLSGSTRINVTNPRPGTTATLVINTSVSPSASFSSNVKQPSGSLYVASPSGNIDIISFTAVDSTTVYAFPAQSFV
jgi:hypothetical protein